MADPISPLSEKNFIHEGYKQNPFRFWFWLSIAVAISFSLWGAFTWYASKLTQEYRENPFLQVTNRQMSLFLWQEPEFMRNNASNKSVYMPAFKYIDKVTIDPSYADDYVIAPPEVIFRYHTWKRLISHEIPQRHIPLKEFKEFLSYAEEWQPQNWPQAPENYIEVVRDLDIHRNLEEILPYEVKIAFQGWKNYFLEGDSINSMIPTTDEIQAFLKVYPHYASNYWRNIIGAKYLHSLSLNPPLAIFPKDELSPFLRAALYNYLQATQESREKQYSF